VAVKIRLKRTGSKRRPFYRVVVTDSRKARDSRSIEDIGYYNPIENPAVVNVDRERVDFWTGRGAQFSDTVKTILRSENTVHQARRDVPEFTPEVVGAKKPKRAEKDEAGEKPARARAKAPKPAPKSTPRAASAPAEASGEATPKEKTAAAADVPEAETPAVEAPGGEDAPKDEA
jgi:small subunit ribosomal protein S16